MDGHPCAANIGIVGLVTEVALSGGRSDTVSLGGKKTAYFDTDLQGKCWAAMPRHDLCCALPTVGHKDNNSVGVSIPSLRVLETEFSNKKFP